MTTVASRNREKAAHVFHALSDETRIRILERLSEGEQCVCDLTDAFKTGQSRLSFHLRVLKDAGLVRDRPEGRWIYYSLNHDGMKEVVAFIACLTEATRDASTARVRCT